jgi:hypothetical protein
MIRRPFIDVLIAGIFCLLAIGGYVLWYGMVASAADEAARLAQELGAQGEAESRALGVEKKLAELEAKEAGVYGHLVSANDIVPFLEQLEATGERLGSNVEVVSVTNAPGTPLETLSLSLRITGSFDAVMRTLGAIEYQTYDTALTNLTLDTPPGEVRAWSAAATFAVGMRPATPTNTP